ncbi:hypothetical protein FHS96_001288 [Sphingomonas zeicaulis]|uniref:hypothetical protein n=1 Tax=Sphingomonas zeicaulis TaxID=1632740 RepID=UPI003D1E6468
MASVPPPHLSGYRTFIPGAAALLVDQEKFGWLVGPNGKEVEDWYLYTGLRLASWSTPELGGAVFHFRAGLDDEPSFEPDGGLCALTREGLRTLITNLQGISKRPGEAQ